MTKKPFPHYLSEKQITDVKLTTENKAIGGSSAISGWCFTAGSKFGVTTSGDLYASNANISGKVNATSGTIGGFNITDSSLYTGLKSNYNVDCNFG